MTTATSAPARTGSTAPVRPWRLLVGALVVALVALGLVLWTGDGRPAPSPPGIPDPVATVGADARCGCHLAVCGVRIVLVRCSGCGARPHTSGMASHHRLLPSVADPGDRPGPFHGNPLSPGA